jgi:hypothetical protein
MADIQFKDEVQKFYDGAKGISSTSGIPDIIEYIHGDYSVVVNLVRKLINEEKYKPEEILILFPGRDNRLELYSLLPKDIQDNTIVTKDLIEGKMLITTYHSAKGLENRICILMDIDKTIGRKLTYVGMTRAFQYLYIHSKNFIDLNTLIDNIPGRLTLSDILDFDINNTLLFKTTDDFSF